MNINNLNPIQSVNVEQRVGHVEPNGTFKELLDAVMAGKLIALVNDYGHIIGGSYNMPATDLVEDNINKIRFERRYRTKPLMDWVLKAFEIKANPAVAVYGISEVVENGDDIYVTLKNGEIIRVSERSVGLKYHPYSESRSYDDLPGEIDLDDLDLDRDSDVREIRRAIKNEYGYFLAKDYDVEENMDWDEETESYHLYDVQWGRKASANELN